MSACAFLTDGSKIVSGSDTAPYGLTVWDASTGREMLNLGLDSGVQACAFSPRGDRLARHEYRPVGQVALREGAGRRHGGGAGLAARRPRVMGAEVLRVLARRRAPGHRRAGRGWTRLSIFDGSTGRHLAELVLGDRDGVGYVPACAFSADGRFVACSEQNNLVLWDLSAQSEPKALGQHGLAITCCAFAPDGRLVSGSYDKTLKIWNTSSSHGAQSGHNARITACGFSPDGSRVATSSADKTLRVWDAATGGAIAVLTGHGREVQGFEFSYDGSRLLSRADDGVIAWEAPSGRLLAKLGPWFGDIVVRGSAISPDGACVALGCRHHRLELVDPATGKTLVNFGAHGDNPRDFVEACRFLAGGRRLLSVGFQGTFKLWDTACGALVVWDGCPVRSSPPSTCRTP